VRSGGDRPRPGRFPLNMRVRLSASAAGEIGIQSLVCLARPLRQSVTAAMSTPAAAVRKILPSENIYRLSPLCANYLFRSIHTG